MLPVNRTLQIQYSERFCIGECRYFQLLSVPIRALEVVLRRVPAFEERAVEGDMARLRVLLR